jgi:hypothetical protein
MLVACRPCYRKGRSTNSVAVVLTLFPDLAYGLLAASRALKQVRRC